MATAASSSTGGGIPLDEYRRDVPPGWSPGNMEYPLKLYLERVKMWYRIYEGPDESVGPLLAGRLRGRAQQIALTLRLPDPHGGVDIGDSALVRLSVDEVRDPVNGQVIQQAIPSGVQALLAALRAAFGEADQLRATRAMEVFFEFKRGRMALPEWSVQWQLNLDEAITHSGLDLNNVARTYLYLKSSQLSQKTIDDLLLQVHGDMARFDEIRTLMLRMSHRSFDAGSHSALYEDGSQSYGEDDGSWSAVTDNWSDSGPAGTYHMDELYAWYDDGWYGEPWDYEEADYDSYYQDWPEHYDYGWDDEQPEDDGADQKEDSGNTQSEKEDYFKGKGRPSSMGLGCGTCGSKWHNTHSCPLNDAQKGKGKNYGKNKGKYKGSGKGKGYGKSFNRKGFGRPKGYKGFGKKGSFNGGRFGRKGYLLDEMPKSYMDYYGGAYLMNKKGIQDTNNVQENANIPEVTIRDTFNVEDANKLFPGRKVRFADHPEQESPTDGNSEQRPKKLNFPEINENAFESYHTVRGKKICGLLVDPGASSGLVGTDTLRELLDSGMVPQDKVKEITWGPSSTTVTGISGQADSTLARVSLPFGLGLKEAEYTADLIGGSGSTCPALLPNTSLRQLRTVMLTQWYENGDGVMICSTNGLRPDHPQADLVVTKLLLAESGHYILPVNQVDQTMTEDEKTEILRLWRCKKKTGQAAAREQSDNCHLHDNSLNIDSNKLQFNTETLESELPSLPEPKMNDNIHNDVKISMKVDDTEPAIQVLKVDTMDEEYDETQQSYPGDQFPAHLPNGKLKYLSKLYKAIPEEFYTKTRRAPVTPRNARSWARNRKNSHFHLWEFCSGSGRLSFLAVCAGLMVMFPLDYRYGWDLGCSSHRKLIDEIENNLAPDVEYMSPACRPWSIASTRRDLEQTQRERDEEMPTIEYLKSKAKKQCRNHRGYVWEQPWSSAMWPHLEDNPGDIQRTDQCRFGACDEVQNPILKPTGLQSSLALRHSLRRCKGHMGKRHGWLQGQYQGACRTTLAAIYPEALCRAIIKDVKRFVSNKTTVFSDFYKCERCSLGRAATDDLRHTFIPGECRHGRWPEGEGPKDKKKAEQERREQDDLWETFRKEAIKNEKVGAGKVSAHSDFAFDNEQLLIFKMVMVKLLDESIKEFELAEMEKRDYEQNHWLQDPTALGWIKKVFKDYMDVKGVMSNLLPWSKPTPAPVLTLEQAPLRLLVQGSVMRWTIGKMEDLRELSASQIHEPMELDDDWMVAIFGNDPNKKETTSSSSTAVVPVDQLNEDQEEPAGDLVPLEPPEHDSEEPDKIAVHPGGLKPTYDFRRIFKKLPRLALDDETAAKRLILGLHERLWHSGLTDTVNILRRCGMPHHVCRLAPDAVASCMICRKYSRAGRRPQYKGVNLSCNFNDLVQTDIFHFQDEIYLITVDEATRYKIATKCTGRFLKDILSALMTSWIRFFGPMRVLVTDQESSLMTVAAGEELQRLGIERRPAGTTSGKQGQRHTTTGLVEKHIDLIKLTMVKIQAEASRWGIEVQGEELAAEASMAQSTTMSVGGYSPVTMLFGILPRGFMDPEAALHGDIEEGACRVNF